MGMADTPLLQVTWNRATGPSGWEGHLLPAAPLQDLGSAPWTPSSPGRSRLPKVPRHGARWLLLHRSAHLPGHVTNCWHVYLCFCSQAVHLGKDVHPVSRWSYPPQDGTSPHQKALFSVLSGHCILPSFRPSRGAIQVSQLGEAGAPVLEAAVVLVLITQAGQDGAQCPCHRPVPFIVIDERCVVGWDAEVTVRSL